MLASQWIPDDPALWQVERYPDFLAARRELLAIAANTFLAGLRSGASHAPDTVLERIMIVDDEPEDRDSRAAEVAALVAELIELGCVEPAVDCEVADPATGSVLAIAEACWPEGLQPGQGSPLVLELDPEESDIPRLKELGYEVFTSAGSLRGYVRRRNQEAAGPVDERPADPAENAGSAVAQAGPVDPAPSPDVRASFERAMKDVYVRAKDEANYNATYFVGMLSTYGGLGTAQRLLASTEISAGFGALYERGRLDLTVEAVVVQPQFAGLFTDEEIAVARRRLDDLGYH